MSLRAHPIHRLITHSAYFGHRAVPSKAELDELQLPAGARRAVREAARHAAAIHDEGSHAEAWAAADDAAAGIIDSLPEELRAPDYLEASKPDELDGLNPDELAAKVPREPAGLLGAPDPLADVTNPDELAARIPR